MLESFNAATTKGSVYASDYAPDDESIGQGLPDRLERILTD